MGTNNPNLPNSVLSDEEAIQYLASVVNGIRAGTYVAVTGSPTVTAAQLVGGVIAISGGSTATITTDTAANIITQMNALMAPQVAVVGSTFTMTIINDNSGILTVAGGTNVVLSGNSPTSIAAGAARRYIGKYVDSTHVNLYAL